jgi:hypothetical protein
MRTLLFWLMVLTPLQRLLFLAIFALLMFAAIR